MTNIVVLIKQVPDTWSERKLSTGDWTLDRDAADAVLDEINERAVEEALLIKEREIAAGGDPAASTVTVLTAGPARAAEAIRKALSMGADKGVHLLDDQMHGSDMVQTGWALARAMGAVEGVELVIAGNEATDGTGGAVPAILAEYQTQLADARNESARIIEEARQAADSVRSDLQARAESDIAELRARANADIESAKAQAIADLRGEVTALAIGAAEQVVGRNLDQDTNAALVEAYINSVGADR